MFEAALLELAVVSEFWLQPAANAATTSAQASAKILFCTFIFSSLASKILLFVYSVAQQTCHARPTPRRKDGRKNDESLRENAPARVLTKCSVSFIGTKSEEGFKFRK